MRSAVPRRQRRYSRALGLGLLGCLSLAALSFHPPGGRGEDSPPLPGPAEDVWKPRLTPKNPKVQQAAFPASAGSPIGPDVPEQPLSPPPPLPAAPTRRPPLAAPPPPVAAPDADVLWTPRKSVVAHPPRLLPASRLDAPIMLPPPTPVQPDAEPPDADRAVLLGAARNAVKQQNWVQALARFEDYFNRYGDDIALRKEYAGVLVQAGRVRDALAEYQRLIAREPGDLGLLIGLGDVAVQAKEYTLAVTTFVRALQAKPDDVEVAVKLARAYVFDEDFGSTLRVYDQYLARIRPDDNKAPRTLGDLLIDLERPGDALPFLKAQLEKRPGDVEIQAALVRAYARLGDRTKAIEVLQALADRTAHGVGVRQQLGDALYASESYELAAEVYGQVLQLEPANGFALLGLTRVQMKLFEPQQAFKTLETVPADPAYERSALLARAEYHQLVGEYFDAKEIYRTLLRRNEADYEVRLSLGQLYEFIREDEKAKAEYCKIPPSARQSRKARLGVASTLTTQRHFVEAVDVCRRLLAEKPADGAAMSQLVRTLGKAGRALEAVAQARLFLQDNSRDPSASLTVRLALAKVLRDDRKFKDAANEYELILSRPTGRLPEAYYGLARSLEAFGDHEKAHHVLAEITSLTGGDVRNRVLFADLYSGDFDDGPAIEMLQGVLKFEPDNLAALIRLADSQARLDRQTGKVCDAVATAKAILALSPSNVRGLLALARALATAQDFKGSIAAYEQLLAGDRDFLPAERERARVLYSAHQYDAGAGAYAQMRTPSADDQLQADLNALTRGDARAGVVFGPCLAAGLTGEVLTTEASKAAAALGDANSQAALQRILLDYQARRVEQEGSRLEGALKDNSWRHYAEIPIAHKLIDLEPSNTSALFDLGQDFGALKQNHNEMQLYSQDLEIDPTEYEAGTALQRSGLELRPQATAGVDFFQERGRDGLADIQRTFYRSQFRYPFGDEDQYVSLGFTRANLVPKEGGPLAGNILSAGFQDKFSCDDRLTVFGLYNLEMFRDRLRDRVTFDMGGRYAFCDLVTARANLFLENVEENGQSLIQDIYRFGFREGADFQPTRIWSVGETGTYAHYSDKNDMVELLLANNLILLPPPCQLKFVLSTDLLAYHNQSVIVGVAPDFLPGTIHPYFAPGFYNFYEARLEWKQWISRDYFVHSNQCWYSLQYGLGADNSFNSYNTFRALANFDVRPWLSLSADAQVILSPVYNAAQATAFMTLRFP
jgi:tetratricopeptide (TPR) repeat protein